ncbi:MAG TPA: SGNH/GDSL hydrolase family protein [Planctomycetota bacterium]|nr:SGNH/GDSL hydrolase family protein [Planctomycetota bacterium]
MALAVGAWREHASRGVELVLVALGLILLGPAYRRLLVLRGRAKPAPRVLAALELASLSGLLVYPVGLWSLLVGGLAALGHALPSRKPDSPRATAVEEMATAGMALLAGLLGLRSHGALALVLLVVLAFSAYRPGADRSVATAARRFAAFALLAATGLLRGYSTEGFHVALVLAAIATLASLADGRVPLRESYRSFAVLALNTCVLFVLLNLLAWGALAALETLRHGRDAASVTEAQTSYDPNPRFKGADLTELTAETWRPLRFEPFTLFRERERQGRFVNVDPNGFRAVKDQGPWPPDKSRLNVFVFGGSTTFGYGVADDDTIPSHLQEALAHVHSGVCVYNFGRGYYYSVQERILFEQLLLSGAVPSVAVFVDGLNDFQVDSVPAMATQLDAATERASEPELENLFQDLARKLPVAQLASSLGSRRPADTDFKDEKVIAAILDRYRANERLIELTANGFGVRALFVFQPVPTYHFTGPLHPLAASGLAAHERSRYGYPKIAAVRETLGADFLWLGDMQEGMTGALYVDAVHYSGPMCAAIAQKIAQELLARGLEK